MPSLKPSDRRPEFEACTQGWGSDKLDDLQARLDLAQELFPQLGGFTAAEQKVVDAMRKQLAFLLGYLSWYERGERDGRDKRASNSPPNKWSHDDYLLGYAAGEGARL